MRIPATCSVALTTGSALRPAATRWLPGLILLLLTWSNSWGQVVVDQGPLPAPASVTIPRAQWGAATEYTLSFPHQGCGNLAGLRVEVGLDSGPDHATGTTFTTTQQVTVVVSSTGGSVAPVTFTPSLAIAVPQAPAPSQPEHWRTLDVRNFLGSNSISNDLTIKISVPSQPIITGTDPGTQRILLRCTPTYQTYNATSLAVTATAGAPATGYEQTLRWTSTCPLVTTYQLQLLFRPVKIRRGVPALSSTNADYDPNATPSPWEWNQSSALIETDSPNLFYQLTLAEGEGTYHWRVRAIGNQQAGGATNPVNWGPWAFSSHFSVAAPDEASNWIYSRFFSEGGHVAEKLTFANGLQQVRQLQTRLATPAQSASTLGQQVIATQTLQDFAGRDAVTSLPIPLMGTNTGALGFRRNLLTSLNGDLYDATHFDLTSTTAASNTAKEPLQANEQGYYSSPNDRVADAEGYPFTRTVFSNDGTNRVVEQGGVGSALRVRPTTTNSNPAHTVRTSYAGVAPEEVIRLFGPEAPEVNGLYKVVTTDPNNVSSVTYQTKDGKTIATALSEGGANTALQSLPSATSSRTFISEVITDRGQLVTKTLSLTENTPVTINYGLTPTQLQNACGNNYCSTCDYQVIIRIIKLNVEPDSMLLDSKSFVVQSSAQCSTGQVDLLQNYTKNLGPGAYQIERELVPATTYPVAGMTTKGFPSASASVRSLTEHLALLRTALNAKFALTVGEPWRNMTDFLTASNVDGLYTYLNGKNYTQETHDGQLCYKIPVANPVVAGCDEYIYFPHLIDYCPPAINLANPAFDTALQAALDPLNQQYGKSYTAADLLTASGYTPAQFNQLIVNMDTATAKGPNNTRIKFYDSNQLVNCWQGILASLEALLYINPGASAGYRFDLVSEYLQCTGLNLLYPISSTVAPSPYNPSRAYEQFLYDPNEIGQVNCVRAAGVDPTVASPVIPSLLTALADFPSYPLTQRNQVYDCLHYFKSAVTNGTYTPGAPPSSPTLADAQAAAAQATQQAQLACEDRRAEFRRVLLLQLHQQNQVVEGDVYAWTPGTTPVGPPTITTNPAGTPQISTCQLEAMVQRLVEQCQHDVQLTATPATDPNTGSTYYQVGTPAEIALANQALFSPLSLYMNTGSGCPPNLPAPVLPWIPVIQNANPAPPLGAPTGTPRLTITSTARDLLTAISLLTAKVNQELLKTNRTQLGCTGGQVSTLQEKTSNIFSLTTVLSNWTFGQATTDAGEPNVYATLIDARNGRETTAQNYSSYNYYADYVLVTDRGTNYNDACTPAAPAAPTAFPTGGVNVLSDVIAPGSGATAPHSYWLRFIDPLSSIGVAFDKETILNISAPYIKFFPSVTPNGASLTASNSLGITVTLLVKYPNNPIPQTREAVLQVVDAMNCGTCLNTQDNVIVWKQLDATLAQNCATPALCYAWSTEPQHVPTPPAGFPIFNPQPEPCNKTVAKGLLAALTNAQDLWVDGQLTAFTQQFQDKCVALANQQESFTIGYRVGYHHFTLYYYDRAGNLMRTVPPAGVAPLSDAQVAACLPPSPGALAPPRSTWPAPVHRLSTTYVYNSLHQLELQKSPDGGETHFFYNRKGQLRFSQNARQRADATPSYSYTRYDALGRVTEVGETTTDATNASATGDAELPMPRASLEDMSYPPATAIRQVTRTVYGGLPVVAYRSQPQRYLTNRVSYSYYDVDGKPGTQADNSYTYYSYDPHGNVEWLGQSQLQTEPPAVSEEDAPANSLSDPQLGPRFVRYEYDLVSNKVTKVLYQEGQVDQFYHRYGYDGDNRLTLVETSTDGAHWEQDAHYTYFAHGPLKRLELGEDHVQGVDYTYTLQGWLKGLNHPGVDPGADGTGTSRTASATDAFGMVLGYYAGDYNTSNTAWRTGNSSVLQPQYSLYNGNIAAWTSKTRDDVASIRSSPSEGPVGEQYRYDQLNRLTSSSTTRFALGGGSPTATQDYATAYSYDPNGNLRTLTRNGNASVGGQPLAMDQLSYSYDTAHDQDNRLLRVNDAVPDAYADDIKYNQSTANQYVYDAIGNLTSDNTGGVTKTITWNVYGKISQVVQSNGVLVRYGYDAQGNRIRKSFSSDNGVNWRHVYYVRDATGNVLAVYEQTESPRYPRRPTDSPTILGTITLTEQPLYGSSRLGERQLSLALNSGVTATDSYQRVVGQKRYELTDHLGNVRALVSDTKLTDVAGTYKPDLKAYYNYYPFGMLQPNRNGPGTRSLAGGYRYGYNGKEMDNNGELGLTSYDYGFRIYSPGLGKFLSVDPLSTSYPWYTPYQFAGNSPIIAIDLDGEEEKVVTQTVGKVSDATVTIGTAAKVGISAEEMARVEMLLEKARPRTFNFLKYITPGVGGALTLIVLLATPAQNGSGAMNASFSTRENQEKIDFESLSNKELLQGGLTESEKNHLDYLRQHYYIDKNYKVVGSTFITLADARKAVVISEAVAGATRTSVEVDYNEAINIGKDFVGAGYTENYKTQLDGTQKLTSLESADGKRLFRLPVIKMTNDPITGNLVPTGRYDANLQTKSTNVSWKNGSAVKRGEITNTHLGIK